MLNSLKDLYNSKGFISASVKRDFKSKYKSSILGLSWVVLQPLAMIVVYTLIFSQVMKAKLPGVEGIFSYSIYLCSGLLAWGLFSEQLNRAKGLFIENANMIKKVTFPKLCLPIVATTSSIINFLIIFSIFTAFLVLSGNFPGIVYFWFFPVLILQVLFCMGISLAVSIMNVFFRDVGQIVDVVLQFMFWGTPIVYSIGIIPDWAKTLIYLNPMAHFVKIYQKIMVEFVPPTLDELLFLLMITIISLFVGVTLFKRHENEMVDEL